MSKYNTKTPKKTTRVSTHEGGVGYKLKDELELMNILANGLGNKFYETEVEQFNRLKDVIGRVVKSKGPEFVAKALVYARTKMAQRTSTHAGSVLLAPYLSGTEIGKYVYTKRNRNKNIGGVVYRVDDILEMVALYQMLNPGKRLPNAMTKGFKKALESADAHELAKYQGKGKSVSLVDVVNLVHPVPSESMKDVFNQLMNGKLKQSNTAEDKQSYAGQVVAKKVKSGELNKEEAETVLAEMKADNWKELLESKKIGYLALLRNLRNIVTQADASTTKLATDLLVNKDFILKSKVWPHQIDIALEVLLSEFSNSVIGNVVTALNTAYELAIPNMADAFIGRTAVLIDTSASMYDVSYSSLYIGSKKVNRAAVEKASLIGATLAKGIGADLYQFGNYTEQIKFNPTDSINTIKNQVLRLSGNVGHGTVLTSSIDLFLKNNDRYDRIFVISDMQTKGYFRNSLKEYSDKMNVNPYVYTIHLNGYNQTIMPQNNERVFELFGYGSDIYELAKKVELNPMELIKEIESIRLY